VALCVANTYGSGDRGPTPHGKQLAIAAAGKLPLYIKGWAGEAVGIEDAPTALILAAERGETPSATSFPSGS
jgi:dihydroflavonol-4-reductase